MFGSACARRGRDARLCNLAPRPLAAQTPQLSGLRVVSMGLQRGARTTLAPPAHPCHHSRSGCCRLKGVHPINAGLWGRSANITVKANHGNWGKVGPGRLPAFFVRWMQFGWNAVLRSACSAAAFH